MQTGFPRFAPRCGRRAFTLLELMTVLVVITILMVVAAPAFPYFRQRAQKAKCVGNLRSIYAATSTSIQDHGYFPQISGNGAQDAAVAQQWIDALKPYGLTLENWVCPTVQGELHSPDLSVAANTRVDYLAMPFPNQRDAAYRFPRQPWFIEAADVHGNGQEVVFPDGHVEEAFDVFRAARSK